MLLGASASYSGHVSYSLAKCHRPNFDDTWLSTNRTTWHCHNTSISII